MYSKHANLHTSWCTVYAYNYIAARFYVVCPLPKYTLCSLW